MIDHINTTRACKIVTIEDPIEVIHADKRSVIWQREIGTDTDDYAQAMRRVLRQDPDVIFIGEMRDSETVGAALSAAETGHLVLSTLHTMNATETINRVLDFFPPRNSGRLGSCWPAPSRVSSASVWSHCRRGGRAAAIEAMVVTGRIADRIIDPDGPGDSIEEQIADGDYHGMQTFDQSLFGLVKNGEVSLNTALAAATNPHDFRVALQSARDRDCVKRGCAYSQPSAPTEHAGSRTIGTVSAGAGRGAPMTITGEQPRESSQRQ